MLDVSAQSVMKQCGEQWQAAKQAGTTNGETWPQFLKDCRTRLASTSSVAVTLRRRRLRPLPQPSRLQANAMRSTPRTRPRLEPPVRRSASSSPRAAPAMRLPRRRGSRARAASSSDRLAVPLATTGPAPAPAPSTYGAPAPTEEGQFASPQEAQGRCPGATVVWVNENSHIYHVSGTRDFGNTKRGAYMCEADAQAAGNRAAKNERHP
jgi:hypothetical protein